MMIVPGWPGWCFSRRANLVPGQVNHETCFLNRTCCVVPTAKGAKKRAMSTNSPPIIPVAPPSDHTAPLPFAFLLQAELNDVLRTTRLPGGVHNLTLFHLRVADIFTRQYDAHTNYLVPWELNQLGHSFRVAYPQPYESPDGQMLYRLGEGPAAGLTWNTAPGGLSRYEAIFGGPNYNTTQYRGKQIATINAVPVDRYVRRLTDRYAPFRV